MTIDDYSIRIGQLAIRFLLEGHASGGSVAVFEVDVPVGAKVPIAHRHEGYVKSRRSSKLQSAAHPTPQRLPK